MKHHQERGLKQKNLILLNDSQKILSASIKELELGDYLSSDIQKQRMTTVLNNLNQINFK